MEDLGEGIARTILRIIKWIVVDAFMETLLYWYGRVFLKIITIGQYPKKNDEAENRCVLAGFILFILTLVVTSFLYPL